MVEEVVAPTFSSWNPTSLHGKSDKPTSTSPFVSAVAWKGQL